MVISYFIFRVSEGFKLLHLFFRFFILFIPLSLFAGTIDPNQPDPDAGRILKEIEQLNKAIIPQTQDSLSTYQEEENDKKGPSVTIKSFQIVGNEKLTIEQIESFLSKFSKIPLTLNRIKKIPGALADFYNQQGFVAFVEIPDQDLTQGVLQLKITEGQFGGIEIIPQNGLSFVKPQLLENFMTYNLPKGAINLKEIERRIGLINDLPGIKAKSALKAGNKAGEAKIGVLVTNNASRIGGLVTTDNYGSRATGRERLLGSFRLDSPFYLGDQAQMTLLKSQGVDYVRMDYSVPLGPLGWRVGPNFSFLQYDVVSQEFRSLKPRGKSYVYGLTAKYPLQRSPFTRSDVSFGYTERLFENKDNTNGLTSDYKIRVGNFGIRGDLADQWGLGGINRYDFNIDIGRVDLNGSPNFSSDQSATGARTHGHYKKFSIDLNREQFLPQDWSLFGKIYSQWADRNLDASEKIYLGGPTALRAYPTAEGAGNSGYLANFEVRKRLAQNFTLTGFYDLGHVRQFRDNYSNVTPNVYTLKGYGLMLALNGPQNTQWSLIVADRVGENPNRTISGTDQDGSKRDPFIWLRGALYF